MNQAHRVQWNGSSGTIWLDQIKLQSSRLLLILKPNSAPCSNSSPYCDVPRCRPHVSRHPPRLWLQGSVRISPTPKGSVLPTALYALIEDVVAVDGGGGQMYRYALWTRYLSSPYFRRMLLEVNCFWSGESITFAVAITTVIITVSEPVAYTLGWSLLFAWASSWTLITIPWVQSDLRREKLTWEETRGQGGIPFTDDITVPATQTNFELVQECSPHFLPWIHGSKTYRIHCLLIIRIAHLPIDSDTSRGEGKRK
ncbi:hypothetical protein N7523_001123 [Penicillium sp. IBT 18751x]|nr:hypothetical protein N7523_001123 [Penicillium sp. IBT 18751x]